jgi:hypothetical protein
MTLTLIKCVSWTLTQQFNPLKDELNPICHLLALLGARHIVHVGGLRVKRNRRRSDQQSSFTAITIKFI